MPPRLRQNDMGSNAEIFFEPIGNIERTVNPIDPVIKQDIASEDGFPRGLMEDAQLKSMIGAYRSFPGGLPAEKGFPIQIGSELFRLSGASIMSDAPSYFSKFFEEQVKNLPHLDGSIKTLYIDRDPETFKDIARHLQGYYVHPRDGQHYVKLFADAQFYSLPKLGKQLIGLELDVQIGERQFKIPMSAFSAPGDSPNFFTLAFGMFVNSTEELFPGLDREGLIRPPPMEAPKVPGRSAKVFEDLLHLLRGYPLNIRDAEHRSALLKDCRYYNLKGLEQRVVYHEISFDPQKQNHDILMRIEDLRQTGLSVRQEKSSVASGISEMWASYARPYTDDPPYELIVEIADSSTTLDLGNMRASFYNQSKARVTSLFNVIKTKLASIDANLGPLIVDTDSVPVTLGTDAHIILDGADLDEGSIPHANQESIDENATAGSNAFVSKKRKISHEDKSSSEKWSITRGQWRICIAEQLAQDDRKSLSIGLHAVKLDAISGPKARNQARRFLAG